MIKKIFYDTDCISSFLWINKTNLIEQLYSGRIVIPSPVYRELSNPSVPQLKKHIDILISNKAAVLMDFEVDKEEYKIYRKLTSGLADNKRIGKGEAATITLAKANEGIVASNNLRDIVHYIRLYDLPYITTAMILKEGLEKQLITEREGNKMWEEMLKRRRRLPADTFTQYLKNPYDSNINVK